MGLGFRVLASHRVSKNRSHQGCEGTANSNVVIWWTKNVTIVPIHKFSPGTEANWYKRILPVQTFFFWDRPHCRFSFNFQFCQFQRPGNFNVQVPERCISFGNREVERYQSETHKVHDPNMPGTAYPTWGDIFESCFETQSLKLESLLCHVSVKRDVRALSFELCNCLRKYHPTWD